MRKWLFLGLWFVFSVSHAEFVSVDLNQTNASFFKVVEQLKQQTHTQGQFTQNKYLRVLKRPLKSSGTFSQSTTSGVRWQIVKPITLTLLLTDSELVEVDSSGKETRKKIADHPELHIFSSVFIAMISGVLEPISAQFDIGFEGNVEHWSIQLKPKSATILAKIFSQIVLSGSGHIESIQMFEKKGDHTDIFFIMNPVTQVNGHD